MPKRLLPWMALCACTSVFAAPPTDPQRLQALAGEPYWLALGHYERAKLGGWRSFVDDPDFFLAKDGERHPEKELAATVAALYASATSTPSASTRRAPAGCASNCS